MRVLVVGANYFFVFILSRSRFSTFFKYFERFSWKRVWRKIRKTVCYGNFHSNLFFLYWFIIKFNDQSRSSKNTNLNIKFSFNWCVKLSSSPPPDIQKTKEGKNSSNYIHYIKWAFLYTMKFQIVETIFERWFWWKFVRILFFSVEFVGFGCFKM